MIFQNLSLELRKDVKDNKIIQVLLITLDSVKDKSTLNNLWAVGTLKYWTNIEKENVIYLLNSEAKINIILYNSRKTN